ncbi:methyl-accepting chemotaxis protein [Oryzifoliimicrobium ureilyticus]|uniref:methyl-accepting chemotaxis protein n=1 Tax=Oryzifoliimicrobium ureilyticus TaxID=3113724 RepID=UPI00307653C3
MTKIAITLAILIVFSTVSGVIGYHGLERQRATAQITVHTYTVLETLDAVIAAMVDQETGMRAFLLSGDSKFLEPQKAGAAAYQANLAKVRALTADNPVQQKRLDELDALAQTWKTKIVDAEIPLMQDPKTWDQARAIEISGAGKQSMDGIRAKIKEMKDMESSLLAERTQVAEKTASMVEITTLSSSILIVVLAIAGLFFINANVVRPIKSIRDAMLRLAGGDRNSAIPHKDRKDEIGEMASAVEVFREAASAKYTLEGEAEQARTREERDRRATAEAEALAQQKLADATTRIASALKRMASGDLSFQIQEPFAQEFESLRHDLNATITQLTQTLLAVSDATRSIDTGSEEINRAAMDLSRRTEQQAASLEETAAALDEITTNVTNSAQRVNEARAAAIEANGSAKHSGEVVGNALQAMERIEASSQQIASIIGVIDEIAFQTNLLALNAGVEAARAGEAGKGFAVVAQEVRELAQRSASAAREIKDLIRTSTEQVGGGVKLVRDTGDALKTIEQQIVTMNQHMEAIATSSREQSVALGEVNSAINQMDQVTQQNAAMVEQTSASSSTLTQEASKLKGLIDQFSLSGGRSPLHAQAAAMREAPRQAALSPRPRAMAAAGGGSRSTTEWSEF